eukprot:2890398-Amphidinium_carterae.1
MSPRSHLKKKLNLMPMRLRLRLLDPAGKAYALADSGATNVTLNLKFLGKHRADATPVEMTLAS